MFEMVTAVGIFIFAIWLWHRYDLNKRRQGSHAQPTEETSNHVSVPIQVQSASGTGTYTVDTAVLTCTCPDFTKRRADFPRSDPRRLCKHLMGQIDEYSLFDMNTAPEISDVPSGKGFPVVDRYVKDIGRERFIAHVPPGRDRPWVNLYSGQERYGFNVEDERWAYGRDPGKEREALEAWVSDLYAQPSEIST